MKTRIVDLVNRQIGDEFGSMIQYFVIATRFDSESLPELKRYFSKLAERKKENALRYLDFATSHGAKIELQEVPLPRQSFMTAEETLRFTLEREVKSIEQIGAIAHAAKAEADQGCMNFMEQPIHEQSEEVLLMRELLGMIRSAGESNLLQVEDFLIRKTSVAVEV